MKKLALFAAVAAAGFALAGCDSQAENEVEEQAEALDEAYEADADLEEAMTEGGPDEEVGEDSADELRPFVEWHETRVLTGIDEQAFKQGLDRLLANAEAILAVAENVPPRG